ncbi:MAG: helicase C-terminal domain-containing protein, partial [Nanoarchaeota archaeon]
NSFKKNSGNYQFSKNTDEDKPLGKVSKNYEEEDNDVEDIFDDVNLSDSNYQDSKEYHLNDNVNGFNLYDKGNRYNPLKFSNNKTQEDVVSEILEKIKQGKRVIFIRGVCGTGKSAIALNIAKHFNKTSIVVPGKALQKQYMEDYSNEKYVLKDNHKKLKIKVITGRENHKCLYSENCTADNKDLPCKIELSERNMHKIREYLKENPKVKEDLDIKEVRRLSIAPVCPYWNPIVPSELELGMKSEKRSYQGLNGIKFTIHERKQGCTYYNQFDSYIDADTIIFNSAKYKLESVMNRKPATDIEIIDECDEFLDSFSNIRKINLTRFLNSLNFIQSDNPESKNVLIRLARMIDEVVSEHSFSSRAFRRDPIKLSSNNVLDIFNLIIANKEIFDSVDEDSYVKNVLESVLDFEDFLDETYILFSHDEKGLFVDLVTTNLAGRFKELLDKNKVFVMMSGTIHSSDVLSHVFGIDDFDFVEAEIVNQGSIEILRTGFEIDCRYDNFKNNNITREEYLVAFDEAVRKSVKPALVHINAFDDLPNIEEKERYNLGNLITKSELIDTQKDHANQMINDFKRKKIEVLFTTKCSRGVDFPGDQCNSIIFSKYPNPDAGSIFWKILKMSHPQYYWAFYKDKATREFLQKIYRGVRSKDDKVFVLSPDKRVLDAVSSLNN